MPYTCSKDPAHQSDDPDYCSVCGAKIAANVSNLQTVTPDAPAAVPSSAEICPDCGTPRRSGAKFCEVCRYNFDTHAPGAGVPPPVTAPPNPVPTVTAPPAIPTPTPAVPSVVAAAATALDGTAKWEVVVRVDPSLYLEPDPAMPCPTDAPERVFPLDFAENLLGRRSDQKDIHPEVPLEDPGVSRRHAKLFRQPDGGLILLDVGSSNGTYLNGVEVKPGVRTPLQSGDEITLGCWTRLMVRRI